MNAEVSSDAFAPRSRDEAFRAALSHSRRVRVLKLVLPLAALTVAGAFAFSTYQASSSAVVMSTISSVVEQNKLVMANPKLEGFAKDGRAFAVDALRAIQAVGDDKIIRLDAINARLPLEGGWVTVSAPGGVYDRTRNVLDISGETPDAIKVASSDGSMISMRSAVIDMATGTLRATDSVNLKQAGSAISSEQLAVSKDGKVLLFENKVRMTLDPGGQASGDGDAKP